MIIDIPTSLIFLISINFALAVMIAMVAYGRDKSLLLWGAAFGIGLEGMRIRHFLVRSGGLAVARGFLYRRPPKPDKTSAKRAAIWPIRENTP